MGFAFTLAYSFSISTSSSHSFSHVKQRGAGLRSGRLYIDIRQQGGSAHYMTMPWVPRAASGLSLLRSNSSSRTASLFALLVLGTLATTLSHAFLISNSQPASSSIARLRASALGPSTPFCLPSSLRAVPEGLLDDDGEPQYDAPARAKIEELIKNNKIVLFMKGTRLFPSCGFSNTAIRILDQLNVGSTGGEGWRECTWESTTKDTRAVWDAFFSNPLSLGMGDICLD